jgi:hypothetical protein
VELPRIEEAVDPEQHTLSTAKNNRLHNYSVTFAEITK